MPTPPVFPASPTNGQEYVHEGRTFVYETPPGRWKDATPAARGGYMYVQSLSVDGAPVGAAVGDTWFDPDNGYTYVRYDDGVTVTWLQSGVAAASAADAGGVTNLTWTAATSVVASDTGTDATLTAVDGTNPGLMTVALKTKLDGIEAAADVTDAANVSGAGALMDSEVTSLAAIKNLVVPSATTISTFGASLVDDTTASAARTTLGVVLGTDTPVVLDTRVECIWTGSAWTTNAGAAVPTTATLIRTFNSQNDSAATTPPGPYNVHDIWNGASA